MDSRQLHLFKGPKQRGVKAPPPLEFPLQCMVADTLRKWATPGWLWTHMPMGEERRPITAARLHRMGVTRGWPDFLLLAPHKGGAHWLELKRPGLGKVTDAQAEFAFWCGANGYAHAFADNYPDAIAVLKQWGAVRSGFNTW